MALAPLASQEDDRDMTSDGLEFINEDECYRILRGASLGRVGVRHGDVPLVLPVYFALDGRDIVFRTVPGAKLDAAVLGNRVAFEVDSEQEHWSVLVIGHVREVRDDDERHRVRELLTQPLPGTHERVVRVVAEHVSGRRFPPAIVLDGYSGARMSNSAAQSER
jgi:nitroimidazol reductase NimA-like FMN-containing flavoprotein (pyridoxamine 5'-phosphate oxidase superfamily)